jgi:3-oxoadipate enol-lactonase
MPYSLSNKMKIYYEASGDGVPFVLVHANPFDRRMFIYQMARFSTFFKVINIDLPRVRLFGQAGGSHHDEGSLRRCYGRVPAGERAGSALLGVSVGGVMGLQLGLDYPELFKALILVGCSSMPGDRYQSRIDRYLKEGVAGFHIKHLTDLVSKDFAESKRGRYLLGMHTEMDARLSAPAIAEIFHALQNRDLTARLRELRMPVLIMNGEFDNSLERSKEMSTRIAGAEHQMIPGAGHACCLEDPVSFDANILAFLEKHKFLIR